MGENALKVKWSKREKDLLIYYPRGSDGALISSILLDTVYHWGGIDGKYKGWLNYEKFNLVEELEKRGYDIKTLKFEIKLKDNNDGN